MAARTKKQLFGAVSANDPVGITVPWASILTMVLQACGKDKLTPLEQQSWARNHQPVAVRRTAAELQNKTPLLNRKQANTEARRALAEYLSLSDAELAVLGGK